MDSFDEVVTRVILAAGMEIMEKRAYMIKIRLDGCDYLLDVLQFTGPQDPESVRKLVRTKGTRV